MLKHWEQQKYSNFLGEKLQQTIGKEAESIQVSS